MANANELLKSKHAFGSEMNIDKALEQGVIDFYDILFLKDENGMPKIGWIDADGNKVIVEETERIISVESLPESGEVGKIYIYGEDGYFWNGTKFVNLCKPTDVSGLETQVAGLETKMETKVDAETVQSMIEAYSESIIEVVEF